MYYFKYPFATQQCWKITSIVLCSLMIILGIYNIAHGATFVQLYQDVKDAGKKIEQIDLPFQKNDILQVLQAQLMPIGALIIVAGIIVMAIYILIIVLICLQIDKMIWLKIINIINMIAFGFQFAVGAASCVQVVFFKQLYKPFLQKNFIDEIKAGADGPIKTLVLRLNDAVHMTEAGAVLAFLIGLVCPLILLITLNYQRQQKDISQPYKNPPQSAQRFVS